MPGPRTYIDIEKSVDDAKKLVPFGSGLVRFKRLKPITNIPGPG